MDPVASAQHGAGRHLPGGQSAEVRRVTWMAAQFNDLAAGGPDRVAVGADLELRTSQSGYLAALRVAA